MIGTVVRTLGGIRPQLRDGPAPRARSSTRTSGAIRKKRRKQKNKARKRNNPCWYPSSADTKICDHINQTKYVCILLHGTQHIAASQIMPNFQFGYFSLTQNRLKARFYAVVDQRERMSSHDVMINRFGAPRANLLSASAPLRAARLGWSDEARAPDWTWPRHTTGPSRHTDASVDRSLTREASTIRVVIRPGPSRVTARRRAARRGDGASI